MDLAELRAEPRCDGLVLSGASQVAYTKFF